jgi:TolB-like protein/Tfp pilus assembly protein PilF
MSLYHELNRRNVFRVAAAYLVAAWLIVQVVETLFPVFGLSDAAIRVVVILLAIGLIPALVVSWIYEVTPEGLKLEKDLKREESSTPQTAERLNRLIMVVLVVALSYFALDKFVLDPVRDAALVAKTAQQARSDALPEANSEKSIAVLPFVNLSADRENEYFSDGLTETLLNMLSQLPGLRVTARTSSFAFKGQNTSIADIAGALGVAHVLEGSVQKANDRVRVTAQLIRASDGFHVWSQNYTRPLEDIFAIQDEIATDVADALETSLLGMANSDLKGVSTTHLSAYDSYLKGLEQQAIYSYASLDAAEDHFKQALILDPGFVEARLSLARNYLLEFTTGLLDIDQTRTATGPLLRQVREQDPDNRLARALELVWEQMDFDASSSPHNTEAAVQELLSLVQELPTETFIRTSVANALHYFHGRDQQAIELLQAGLLLDPLEAELHQHLGLVYADSGRLDQARASLQRTIELAPDNPNNYVAMSGLEKEYDNLPAALDWVRRASLVDRADHELAAMLAQDLYHLGLPEEGDYWLSRVQVLAPGSGLARSIEVDRAVAREDEEQVIALASAAIADQVEGRQNAYADCLFHYIDTMMQHGRAKEAYDFLTSVRPEIKQYDQIPSDINGLQTQWASIVLLSGFETFENRKAVWDEFSGRLGESNYPWKKTSKSENYTWDYLMNGKIDQAIDHFLEHELAMPVSKNLGLHRKPLYALFAPVYEDDRVAARLIERSERFAELRRNVRTMLQQPDWSTL